MVSPVVLGVFLLTVFHQFYKFCVYRPKNFPPGPFRIPVFGSYLFLKLINHKRLHLAVDTLCKYYKTSILGFYQGNYYVVVANDQKSAREMLFNPDFDGRNDFLLGRLREPNFKLRGIFSIDETYWNEQRRFSLKNLRDFGFGRRSEEYEVEVRDELQSLVETIKSGPKFGYEMEFFHAGGEISLPKALIGSMGNCFLQIVANERFARSEQALLFKAGLGALDFQKFANEYGNMFGIMNWITYVFPSMSSYKQLRKASMNLFELMKVVVDRQIKTYQEGHLRGFIDLYIKEIRASKTENIKTGYLEDQLLMICTDFVFPVLSAIESQIAILFMHLLRRQDICKKVQDEIEAVVGSGRLPSLDDRVKYVEKGLIAVNFNYTFQFAPSLPYTEATLREILRYETLVPSSVPHRALRDTTLGGYDIPKDTIVFAGLYTMHHSKELWGDPENFRPERFIGANGKLDLKKDFSLPFGAGRRLCAGETFARNTMFLTIAALLQNFNLKPAKGGPPSLDAFFCGLARMPHDFWIKLESR